MSTTTKGRTWQEIVAAAEHYIALGKTDIYLSTYDGFEGEFPWHLVTDLEEGGSHRFDMNTDIRVMARHESGITLRWGFDLETRGSNGMSTYQIDAPTIMSTLSSLPKAPANKLRSILASDAAKVRKQADDYLGHARKLYGDAAILSEVSK